jgi:hypothetical protein
MTPNLSAYHAPIITYQHPKTTNNRSTEPDDNLRVEDLWFQYKRNTTNEKNNNNALTPAATFAGRTNRLSERRIIGPTKEWVQSMLPDQDTIWLVKEVHGLRVGGHDLLLVGVMSHVRATRKGRRVSKCQSPPISPHTACQLPRDRPRGLEVEVLASGQRSNLPSSTNTTKQHGCAGDGDFGLCDGLR